MLLSHLGIEMSNYFDISIIAGARDMTRAFDIIFCRFLQLGEEVDYPARRPICYCSISCVLRCARFRVFMRRSRGFNLP